ncbi:MAG: DinB family protein [Planctomycetes bacterium]|nr:DinB family protein [Planctomycetota bacterium]
MSTASQQIDSYLRGAAMLRQAVADMTREQALARPVPGRWSTLEVVCHLADFEPVYADRMKRVIALEQPTLLGADENRFAATLAYHDRDLDEELDIVDRTRSQMARILRTLPTEAFARVGVHSERGPRTLEQLLETVTNHIQHHVKFIHEKRKALGLK